MSATAAGPPPPAVSKFWVDRRCDHHFIVWWERVSGATGYDLEMRGKEWKRLLTNQNYNGFQFNHWTKDATFRFRIRSVNAHGASDWRKVKSVAPACAVEGLQASYAANGEMRVSWNPAKRATGYDVNFSADNGKSWQRMANNLNATAYTFTKDPAALPYNPNFLVAVQSLKHGVSAGWRNAGIAQIQLTASNIEATSATLNIAGHTGQWWYDADTGPHTACQGPVAAGTSTADLTGLTVHQQYTYTAYDTAGCGSGDALASLTFEPSGDVLTAESVTATSATLKLENHTGNWWFKRTAPDAGSCTAGETDFTNALTGLILGTAYTYKSYDVDGCGDTHEGDSVTFTTGGVSVSNLGETGVQTCHVGSHEGITERYKCAIGFTTGNASTGYTLHSLTPRFLTDTGNPGDLAIALHTASGGNPAASAIPNATLSGDSTPATTGNYTYTCLGTGCSLLASTTYFVVMAAPNAPVNANNRYRLRVTSSTNETKIPSNNGWLIEDKVREGTPNWSQGNHAGMMKVSATVNLPPSLTASGISGTGATLTVGGHTGDWHYKGISGTEASTSCVTVSGSTTDTLSGLTADKLYGYTAHSGASCTGTEIGTDYFSTNDYDVGILEETVVGDFCPIGFNTAISSMQCAVAFTTGSRSGGYTLKGVTSKFDDDSGSPGNIVVKIHAADTTNSANPATTAKVTLSGSDPDTAGLYTYACSGSDCALSASTKYFVVMSTADTSGQQYYQLVRTASDAEAVHPSGNGWSIADVGRVKTGSNAWTDLASSNTGLLHMAADD